MRCESHFLIVSTHMIISILLQMSCLYFVLLYNQTCPALKNGLIPRLKLLPLSSLIADFNTTRNIDPQQTAVKLVLCLAWAKGQLLYRVVVLPLLWKYYYYFNY